MQEYAAPHAHATNSAAECGSGESRGGRIRQEGCEGLLGLVWSNAEKMRLGSNDVRLVVDTAESSCKKRAQRLQYALAADKTDPVFARSYMETIMENAKTEATALVLKGNAKDARNREGPFLQE
jgi:hypothetical protein